jgi:hypothetical protein
MTGYRRAERSAILLLVVLTALVVMWPTAAVAKTKAIVVLPYDASALPKDEQWVGEGVAQILSLAFAQHPTFVQLDRARVKSAEAWGDEVVAQAARAVERRRAVRPVERAANRSAVVRQRLEIKRAARRASLEPVVRRPPSCFAAAGLPVAYAHT